MREVSAGADMVATPGSAAAGQGGGAGAGSIGVGAKVSGRVTRPLHSHGHSFSAYFRSRDLGRIGGLINCGGVQTRIFFLFFYRENRRCDERDEETDE